MPLPDSRPDDIILRLAILAEMQNLTQLEMQKADGISIEAWRSWIKGRRDPGLRKLQIRAHTLKSKIILIDTWQRLDWEGLGSEQNR